MAEKTGVVAVTGVIAPMDDTDTYPVTDPLYGIDGFRNVSTETDRNSIPLERRRVGMVVGVGVTGSTGAYWKLINEPGTTGTTNSDWSVFTRANGELAFQAGGTGGATGGDTINMVGGDNVTVTLIESPVGTARYVISIPTLISGGTAYVA